jgi:K+-sensing histidine kinase KdpD
MHELQSLICTAKAAFDILETGNVGIAGSTGNLLKRSLMGSRELITRSMDESRLTSGELKKTPTLVSEFIREIGETAGVEARAHGVNLSVPPVRYGLLMDVDRQILTAVINHLLQNAFKFTRPSSTVTLKVGASADRIRLEVQDECGGLRRADERGTHSANQPGADRPCLGIGLAFCRSGTEVNGGRLDVRNRGKGCVYTVDLPRSAASNAVLAG